ncbi:hypothetical protein Tco_1237512 [Tanacetum coccineum]
MSSSTSHATVAYTSMSSDDDISSWAHTPTYLEYLAPSDDDLEPAKAQPLLASVSPTILSPDYSTDFEPMEEDPKEDPEEEPEEDPEEKHFEEDEEPLASIISTSALLDSISASEET